MGNISPNTEKLNAGEFEFLITPGDIEISAEDFDNIITPDLLKWTKITKGNWPYYRVGTDEFTYSWEMPGIQMTFNKEMPFEKAKIIADEVVNKLSKYTGEEINLLIIPTDKIIRFE